MSDPIEQALSRPRFGKVAFLAGWAVVTAGQVGLMVNLVNNDPRSQQDPSSSLPVWIGLGLVLLQLVKMPITVRRLSDLGRPTDDAMWVLVPAMNIALWLQLWRKTPTAEARAKRIRSWATQVGAWQAYAVALTWMRPHAALGMALAALGAAVVGVGGDIVLDGILAADNTTLRSTLSDVAALVAGVTALYTLVQWSKRRTASRASWLASLMWAPSVLLALGLTLGETVGSGMGAMVVVLVDMAWMLSVGAVAAGMAATVWIVAADTAQRGDSGSTADVVGRARALMPGTVAVYAARAQLVQVGAQVVIPGIWYAVSFAFSDVIATLAPERSAFSGSTALARGIRGKLFKVLTVGFLGATFTALLSFLPFLDGATIGAAMFDPSVLPIHVVFLEQLAYWLWAWWGIVAMTVLFRERDGLLQAKLARDAARAGDGSAA